MNRIESEPCICDEDVVRKLAALAHPVRLRLLRHISGTSNCCVKEMVGQVGMAQSTVSQHLKVLVEAGLVRYRTERQRSCYCIDADAIGTLAVHIGHLLDLCGGLSQSRLQDKTGCGEAKSLPVDHAPVVNKDI